MPYATLMPDEPLEQTRPNLWTQLEEARATAQSLRRRVAYVAHRLDGKGDPSGEIEPTEPSSPPNALWLADAITFELASLDQELQRIELQL